VLATFALVRAADVVLDPDDLEPRDGDWAEPDDVGLLDAVDVWCEDVLDQLPETDVPPVATEVVGVRDLDLVDDDAWPQALALLSRPPLREAVTAPVRVLLPDGTTQSVRPYAAWWLRDHPVLDGRSPVGLRASGGDRLLAGLYDEAETDMDVDEQVLRHLGGAALHEVCGRAHHDQLLRGAQRQRHHVALQRMAVSTRSASLLRPERANSLLPHSAIPVVRIFSLPPMTDNAAGSLMLQIPIGPA